MPQAVDQVGGGRKILSLRLVKLMIERRSHKCPGSVRKNWLSAQLHFAFAGKGRPELASFGALQVWNDDQFVAG